MTNEQEVQEAREMITGLIRDIDPDVAVEVSDYYWRDLHFLDVTLGKGGRSSRIEVSIDRIRASRSDTEPLRHDLEKTLMNLDEPGLGVY